MVKKENWRPSSGGERLKNRENKEKRGGENGEEEDKGNGDVAKQVEQSSDNRCVLAICPRTCL